MCQHKIDAHEYTRAFAATVFYRLWHSTHSLDEHHPLQAHLQSTRAMATVQAAPVPAHGLVVTPKELPKMRANKGEYVDKDYVS
jgi:hypothetical protein